MQPKLFGAKIKAIMKRQKELYWDRYQLKLNEIRKIEIADLKLYFQLLKNEIKVGSTYSKGNKVHDNISLPENLEWRRWPLRKEISTIQLDPVLPDRPILVSPESSFSLLENFESRHYVRFPVSVKIAMVYDKKTVDLFEIPTIKLSNTWFGTFNEGEACYGISSGIRTEIEPDTTRPYMAICPLLLKNKTEESLFVGKICVRSDYLSLFLHESQLWTNEMGISYVGKNEISQVQVSARGPANAPGATLITKARSAVKKTLSARSFVSIKDFYGAGLFTSR
ncbi:MAG: DUF432 domain-containing protein [Calditrichaeota bacterium]|nr:MAG: DUF432 domain-containing protein [Calditrichota bacterium]